MCSANGFEGTSVGQLAARLNVSKAAVSYHFPGKEDILLALARPLLDELERVNVAKEGVEWPDGARDVLVGYFDILLRHRRRAV
jgi:AcrR family transcriptional regulator